MKSSRPFLPALVVAGALLVAGCGDGDSSRDSSSTPAGNPVDRAFVAQMIPHHRSAVQMAQIARRRGYSPFVKQLAEDVVRTQTQEISTLRAADRRLQRAGVAQGSLGVPEHMTGMDGDASNLKRAKPFDGAFMRMMIPHHEGAVVMANVELRRGSDPELKELAQSIIAAQRREIRAMHAQIGDPGEGDADDAMNQPGGHHGARDPGPGFADAGTAGSGDRRGTRIAPRPREIA